MQKNQLGCGSRKRSANKVIPSETGKQKKWSCKDFMTNATSWNDFSKQFPVATFRSGFCQPCW